MPTVTRIDPTIPVRYGRDVGGEWFVGNGRAFLMLDYGEDHHCLWTIADDATGQIWTVANPFVRVRGNDSLGTRCEDPYPLLRGAKA